MDDSTANRGRRVHAAVGSLALVVGACAASSSAAQPATRAGRLALPALPADPVAEEKLLSELGEGFRVRRSQHFSVACDASQAALRGLLRRIEDTYVSVHLFCRAQEIPLRVSGAKLQIVFCNDWSTYAERARRSQLDPAGTYGFYSQRRHRSVFCNIDRAPAVDRLRREIAQARDDLMAFEHVLRDFPPGTDRVELSFPDGRAATVTVPEAHRELANSRLRMRRLEVRLPRDVERLSRWAIQHETAHHVLFAGGVHVRGATTPAWLLEGLATQFEGPLAAEAGALPGINDERLREFRRAHEQGRLIPVARLLLDDELFTKNTANRVISYAQAWSLVYYLSRWESERFAAYVRALAARRPGERVAAGNERSEFCRFLGPIDETFVRRWEKHILALPVRMGETRR